ncbi:MAG TPA: cupin domain-containing protein [Chryseolinea sp.]|nr:cupin domain-containing protein [Chryseolinea sp.]
MRLSLFAILFLPGLLAFGQKNVASEMYSWKKPVTRVQENVFTSTLFEGSAQDMAFIQMSSVVVTAARKKTALAVPNNEEHLLLMKSGSLTLGMNDSIWTISRGSVALLLPDQKYTVLNSTADSCLYYLLRYRSRQPMDKGRGSLGGGSMVRDWNKIVFKPHDRGGIRNFFERPTPMCKRFEMHVTTLNEGIRSHDPHTHRAEEIVLVIDNKTEMQIGDTFYKGSAGDFYYLGSNVPHAIRNDGKGTCTYFAFQFE